MKICFFNKDNVDYFGQIIEGEINEFNNFQFDESIYKEFKKYKGKKLSSEKIEFLSPLPKNKTVYGIADNYKENSNPLIFFKNNTNSATLIKEDNQIVINKRLKNIWAESELGFVIAKDIKVASNENIDQSYILGYFIANDITGSLDKEDHHLICSKSCPGFLQTGHILHLDFVPKNQNISLYQDKEKLREGKLSYRNLDDINIIKLLNSFFNLAKGDVVLTGAPQRCRERMYLSGKNTIEINIETLEKIKSTISLQYR